MLQLGTKRSRRAWHVIPAQEVWLCENGKAENSHLLALFVDKSTTNRWPLSLSNYARVACDCQPLLSVLRVKHMHEALKVSSRQA